MNARTANGSTPANPGLQGREAVASRAQFASKRLEREHRTILAMLRIYCRGEHGGTNDLCLECRALLDYAGVRLDRCRYQGSKPTCAKCPVHCYLPEQREQMKAVMRYAGPQMLWRHPILALRHLLDGYRPVPTKDSAPPAS
jgi:hypothetical protein